MVCKMVSPLGMCVCFCEIDDQFVACVHSISRMQAAWSLCPLAMLVPYTKRLFHIARVHHTLTITVSFGGAAARHIQHQLANNGDHQLLRSISTMLPARSIRDTRA